MSEERLLTDAELEAMERRCVEASPGPWTAEILGSLEEAKALGRFRWAQPEPDALFIAHAREDIPRLLSEIKRLRALLAKNSNGARKSG